MKINVYYGGRGPLDDPTLYVLKKMEDVLRELRVNIERFNIYEHKNEIATLPLTFKEADGIILATTIEWLGIGGYMQQFLMPAGYMVIRKKSVIPICSRLLCLQPMGSVRENRR